MKLPRTSLLAAGCLTMTVMAWASAGSTKPGSTGAGAALPAFPQINLAPPDFSLVIPAPHSVGAAGGEPGGARPIHPSGMVLGPDPLIVIDVSRFHGDDGILKDHAGEFHGDDGILDGRPDLRK